MTAAEFWYQVRQALLMLVDAIERKGRTDGWYNGSRTSELRKDAKRQ